MEFQRKPPTLPQSKEEKERARRLVVVLEMCSLETAKVGNQYVLLNGDDHHRFLSKYGKDPADYRPDVVHQCLLTLLDSPLNRAGMLKVFMRAKHVDQDKGTLIEVDPRTRAPRTFRQFSRMVVQLLHKFKIRAVGFPLSLFRVIKNPVVDHLPGSAKRYGLEVTGEKVNIGEFAAEQPTDKPIVFVVGGCARGDVDVNYVEKNICFSAYPLSASVALTKLLNSFEDAWKVDPKRELEAAESVPPKRQRI
eukprot:TRINITY_DN30483_c0_g1_i1.p1 TRINITY_DN30483_c0_g1~~TRINITY_DN30483_c0_g1_i1.p1  ORF type:complete len:250 (+),score=67.47 TRINITY_DN30483_c0_g1_i1:73-822(+)